MYKSDYVGDNTGELIDRWDDTMLWINWDDYTWEEFSGNTVSGVKYIRYVIGVHAGSDGNFAVGGYADIDVYDSPSHLVDSISLEVLDGSHLTNYRKVNANLNIDHIEIHCFFHYID